MNLDVLIAVLLTFGAACYGLLAARLLLSPRDVGSLPLGIVFLLMSVWVLGGAIEVIADSLVVFSVGRTAHFVATSLLPVAVYVCFREYTGSRVPTRTVVALILIPLVTITLVATNVHHEFVWAAPFVNADGGFLSRPERWGNWFLFVHAPYSYALTTLAVFSLLSHASAVAPAHRRGLVLLAAFGVAPLAAAIAYDLGFGPATMSLEPLVITAMLPGYLWLLLGERIVEFKPLAYETVFQTMQDPVVVVDHEQRIIGMNRGAEELLDVCEKEALRVPLETVLTEGGTGIFEAIETGKTRKVMTNTGRFLHLKISDIEGRGSVASGGQILMFRDVSDVEKAQTEVRNSEKLLRTLIDHSVNGVIRMRWVRDDSDGGQTLRCIFANAAAGRFLDRASDALDGSTMADIVRLACTGMDAEERKRTEARFERAIADLKSVDIEALNGPPGARRCLQMIAEPVGEDYALTIVDITDRKAKEQHMEAIAWSDPLTGVLNRRGFERHASQRLKESHDDATGALLFVDLNEFKQINDECGHDAGDQLLTIAAERLRKSLRSCDIIGRHGGDEFVALVPDVGSEAIERLAERLTESLEEPYRVGDETLNCSASIGLALYPKNASTLTGLLREADEAMYRAKARGRGGSGAAVKGRLERAG